MIDRVSVFVLHFTTDWSRTGLTGKCVYSKFDILNMSTALYPLASLSQIERSPSREDGVPADLEEDLRAYGCKLIQQAGLLLKQYVG